MKIKLSQFFIAVKVRLKKASPLNIQYKGKKVTHYSKVTYLGCILDEGFSGESMAVHVINNANSRLRILYRQNKFLGIPLRDYFVTQWYNIRFIMHVTLVTLI